MEGKENIACKLLCMACLCVGRSLHEITDSKLKQYYFDTLNEIPLENVVSACPIICWECEALLKRAMSFTEQVRDCYRILQSYSVKSFDECLLTGVTRPPRLKVIINQPITITPVSESDDKPEVQLVEIKDEVRNLWDGVIDIEESNVQEWPVKDCLDNIVVEVDLKTGVQNIVNKNKNKSIREEKRVKKVADQDSILPPEVTSYEMDKDIKQEISRVDYLEQSDVTSSGDETIEKYLKRMDEDEWSQEQECDENRDYFLWTISDYRTCSESESVSEMSVSDFPTLTDETEEHKLWKKSVMLVYRRLCAHQYSSLFRHPISDDRAPWYSIVVKKPMDLTTIRRNIKTGHIRTTAQFQRDVLLMLSNALMYNSSDDKIYKMAKDLHEEAKTQLEILLAAQAQGEPQAPQRRKRRRLK